MNILHIRNGQMKKENGIGCNLSHAVEISGGIALILTGPSPLFRSCGRERGGVMP